MNIKDFVKTNEDGSTSIDTTAFEAALKSELDKARTQASETASVNTEKKLRKSIEEEIRGKLEEEAKMSAEEKLKAEREKFLEEKKAFDKKRIESIYKDAGISDDEIAIMCSLIGEDSDKNIETATKFAEARKASSEEAKKKMLEELQMGGRRGSDGGQGGGNDNSVAKKMAEKYSKKVAEDYVDFTGAKKDN